ncbi:hypothetical protein AST14_05020 [Staphylococcus xylosus]|nr:hypothetical protein AST14_05020 [Staphylococcus xylosus]
MNIYTLRLIVHSIILASIIYVTTDADNHKLVLSNALIYLLPFALDFNQRSLPKDYFPIRYKIGKYIVGVPSTFIIMYMVLTFLEFKLSFDDIILIVLKIFFIIIYLMVGFIILLDWYFLKDSDFVLNDAEKAGRESVRDKQIAANERQRKRQLKQKNDYEDHVSKMSQKKYRKK